LEGPTALPRFAALHTADYRGYFTLGLMAMTADNIEHVTAAGLLVRRAAQA
jgi:hypothetical protein